VSISPLLQVEAQLLRRLMPDLLLREGMTLAGRVAERRGQHGILMLAGVPILAQLPDHVQAGDKLRLLVQDTRGEKVTMKLVQDEPAAAPQTPVLGLPLPDGRLARLRVDEDGAPERRDDGEHAVVALTYDSPQLGEIGLRLEIHPGAVSVRAEVAVGAAADLAEDHADELRERLASVTGRAAEVRIVPRHKPVDLYA
jgi:hypothetical protein